MKRGLLFLFIAIISHLSIVQVRADKTQNASPPPRTDAEKDCGCESQPLPDVLAIVNGVKITFKDVTEPIRNQVRDLQDQVIEARKQELDLMINSNLLEAEAKKRGIDANKLLQTEVMSKIKDATDAEAQAFYDQNKAQIEGEFKDVKDSIIAYLRNQRQREEAIKFAQRLRAASDVKILLQDVSPPASETDRARALATVNGLSITSGDIEDSLKPLVFDVQEQVYKLRQRQVDLRINDVLLDQEAKKRSITSAALLEAEVMPKLRKVTEAEAEGFYQQNRESIRGSYEQVKDKILDYLQALERDRAESAFAEQLRKEAKVEVFLKEPVPPVYNISIDGQPSRGGANAPVTIIEFTDFECPACAYLHPILEEIATEYGDRVKLVIRDFPLEQHTHAPKAAEAAEAAREQGKYWEYIALLFQNQDRLEVDNLKEYATRLELDRKIFDEALDSGRYAEKVQRDRQDGYKVGVDATPTVFINGRRIREKSRENLRATIDAALKEVTRKSVTSDK